MTGEQSNDMHFDAVYVVESLRSTDRKTGTELYDDVIGPAGFRHPKLLTQLAQPSNREQFFEVFHGFVKRATEEDRWPLLHLETHADKDALELTSGESVLWSELKGVLQALNQASRFNLLVTVAACSGAYLASTISPVDRAPVWGVIGPAGRIGDDEVLDAFRAFYAEFLANLDGNAALATLRAVEARQGKRYVFLPAETMFRSAYRRYIDEDCSAEELRVREAEILATARQKGLPSSVDDSTASALVRMRLTDHRAFFEAFREKFFMIDLYPENDTRFVVRYDDVVEGGRGV